MQRGRGGIPAYLINRGTIGNTGEMFLMLGIMLPAFLLAMYEKASLPLEKVVRNIIRATFLRPRIRAYRTENTYRHLPVRALDKRMWLKNTKKKNGAAAKGKVDPGDDPISVHAPRQRVQAPEPDLYQNRGIWGHQLLRGIHWELTSDSSHHLIRGIAEKNHLPKEVVLLWNIGFCFCIIWRICSFVFWPCLSW